MDDILDKAGLGHLKSQFSEFDIKTKEEFLELENDELSDLGVDDSEDQKCLRKMCEDQAQIENEPEMAIILDEVGLGNLKGIFSEESINPEDLPDLEDIDLINLGIKKLLLRKRLRKLCKERLEGTSTSIATNTPSRQKSAVARGLVDDKEDGEDPMSSDPVLLRITDQSQTADRSVMKNEGHSTLELGAITTDLRLVGKFIRLAYNGTVGQRELQKKVESVSYKVVDISDRTTIAVASFSRACSDVLGTLKSTYKFLLEGQEEMALIIFAGTSKTAKTMQEKATKLSTEYANVAEGVKEILTETGDQRALKEKDAEKRREETEEMKSKNEAAKLAMEEKTTLIGEHHKAFQDKEKSRKDRIMEKRETQERQEKKDLEIHDRETERIRRNRYRYGYYYTNLFGGEDPKEEINSETKQLYSAKAHLEEAEKQGKQFDDENAKLRQERSAARIEMNNYAQKMKKCKTEEDITKASVESLHAAVSGLKGLSAMMKKSATFWEMIGDYCSGVYDKGEGVGGVREQIMASLKIPEKKRKALWRGNGFITMAGNQYAQWEVLHDVCWEHMDQLKLTHNELYASIGENPSKEESQQIVKNLSEVLSTELVAELLEDADK